MKRKSEESNSNDPDPEEKARREYLKTVGALIAGLAVGGAAAWFGKPPETVEKTVTAPGATLTVPGPTVTVTVPGPTTPTPTPTPKYKFTFIGFWEEGDPFHVPVKKGFEDACKLYNVDGTFMIAGGDMSKQIEWLEAAAVSDLDGIIIPCFDPVAYNAGIKRAIDNGIPVITANVDAPESARLAYVGQSNYMGGLGLGEYVGPLLPEGAHIVIPAEVPGMSYAVDRSRGIVDGIKKTNPNITYEVLDAGYERGVTTSRITGYLTGHPETKGVFCVGGLTTACTAGVIRDLGLIGKVVAGGFDLTPEALQGIKEGALVVTIDQHPYLQGYLPVVILWFMKQYLMGAWSVDTLVGKVDKTNVADVEELAKQGYR